MSSDDLNKVLIFWRACVNQPPPRTRDELLSLTARSLQQMFGPIRLLFYLAMPPPEVELRCLTPCPARLLCPDVFIYEGSNQATIFRMATEQFYAVPLAFTSQSFGYLVLENPTPQPWPEPDQRLLAQVAIQTARHLSRFKWPSQFPDGAAVPPPPLIIDQIFGRVWLGGRSLYTNPGELAVLQLLHEQPDQLCSRELLQQTLYHGEWRERDEREERLDKFIFRFRQKLEQNAGGRVSLETIRGVGYRLKLVS